MVYQVPAHLNPLSNDEHPNWRVLGLSKIRTDENDRPVLCKLHVTLRVLFACILVQHRIMASKDLPQVVGSIVQNYDTTDKCEPPANDETFRRRPDLGFRSTAAISQSAFGQRCPVHECPVII